MIVSNPFMSIEELNTVLKQYGYYVRATTTVDESIPFAKWVIIDSHGNKTGCKSTIEVATVTRRIEKELNIEKNQRT